MKKRWVLGLVVLVAVIAIGGIGLAVNKSINNKNTEAAFTSFPVTACKVLTPEIAKTILGGTAITSNGRGKPIESKDAKVTTCTYINQKTASANTKTVTIMVRSAKTKTAADANLAQIKNFQSHGSVAVPVFGETAYWNNSVHQLTFIKHNNLYILSSGVAPPSANSVDAAKQIVDAIKDKL